MFFRKALISEEERPENLGEMGNNRDIYCYESRGCSILKETTGSLHPSIKISVMLRFSYMPDQISGKMKNSIFSPNFELILRPHLPKQEDVFKIFTYGPTQYVIF